MAAVCVPPKPMVVGWAGSWREGIQTTASHYCRIMRYEYFWRERIRDEYSFIIHA